MARPPKSKAIERLKKALSQIPGLKELSTDTLEFKKWRRNTVVAIERTFGTEGTQVSEFYNIFFSVGSGPPPVLESEIPHWRAKREYERQQSYVKGLDSSVSLLESMIEEIEVYWEDEDELKVSAGPPRGERTDTNKVFVVHGRDEGAKHTVARFLEREGLKPVILSEQPDEGLTIIEKFEKHAQDVGSAVVLLTPDDVGALQGEESNLKPRARQNVILELGYFMSCLGRDKVCALVKGDIEKPSDYHGVIYIPMDDHEGWQKQLVRNLNAVGFNVDDADKVL